jgi:DNA modification methylase
VIDFTDATEPTETEGDDEVPEVDEKSEPVSKRGEMYELGNSILMCGDSTDAEDVARLMGGEKADMVFTDPPYGIDYSGGRSQLLKKKDYGKLMNDDLEGQDLAHLICNIFEFNKGGADIYICVSPIMQKPFLDFIEKCGKEINAVIVWDKKQAGLGYMAYRRQCEFILFVKGEPFHKGDKTDFDLWSITRDNAENYVHSTQKPVAVPSRAINNSSKQGDLILDLFGGSGSTLIACEKNGRRARLMELDPHYCDVIRRRYTKWAKENGKPITSGCLD